MQKSNSVFQFSSVFPQVNHSTVVPFMSMDLLTRGKGQSIIFTLNLTNQNLAYPLIDKIVSTEKLLPDNVGLMVLVGSKTESETVNHLLDYARNSSAEGLHSKATARYLKSDEDVSSLKNMSNTLANGTELNNTFTIVDSRLNVIESSALPQDSNDIQEMFERLESRLNPSLKSNIPEPGQTSTVSPKQ